METDFLYCKFNERGRKQFDSIERGELESKFPDYAKVGLPAHKAALDGNVECLKDLFSAYGTDGVPSRDVNGATPLHLAVRNSQIDTVKWLLRYTTLTPLDEAKFGETPVHVAAAQGNLECLKVLLNAENKAEVNSLATAVDKSEFTVLYLAILKQCNDCVKYLISQFGAKGVGPFNESGVTASHIAASAGNVEVLKLINQKFKKLVCLPAADGTTPAYHAAQQGQLEALKYLCEKCKCKLTTASGDGAKPIHAAAQCGKTNIIQYIVKQQGNKAVFEPGTDKATPLHYAACNGHIETAEWLLKTDITGKLISAKDKNGDTPAHDAAENGQTEMLKFLLDAGADLYVINDEGNTPYAVALKGDNPETANFVMTEAARSPKTNQQSPQVKIFDLQGDMDVVDVHPQTETAAAIDEDDVPLVGKSRKGKKDGKKKKKRRGSLNAGLENTLQSFDNKPAPSKEEECGEGGDSGPLEFDDDGMGLFEKGQKAEEDEDIVVRYTNKPAVLLTTTEYSTVNEVVKSEEKKQRKKGRKMPKSIQNVLKSGKKKSGDSREGKKAGRSVFSGFGNMGFKSKTSINPLLNVAIPSTPPPTPATGASIAPSDEGPPQIHIPAYIEESEMADPKASDSMPRKSSENAMLLDDTLKHLSSEATPPEGTDGGPNAVPGSETSLGSSRSGGVADARKKFEMFGPTTRGARPPSREMNQPRPASGDQTEAKHAFVKLKPTSGKVGAIASAFSKPNETSAEPKRPPFANLKPVAGGRAFPSSAPKKPFTEQKSAPSPSESTEAKNALSKLKPTVPSTSATSSAKTAASEDKPGSSVQAEQDSDEAKNKFVQLKKVQRSTTSMKEDDTELSKIQLKKATKDTPPRARAIYSKPETEKASGASNELLKLMKNLSAQ